MNQPVTGVSLEEARAFCRWRGARLPRSYEWQYPWGNTLDAGKFPAPATSWAADAIPDDVDAHPEGASPFGVMDLVGNVWQYTDEFQDEHTRAVVLRGSAKYTAHTRQYWYFPPALELTKHNKYFLMSDSYERAASIGFRCAADAPHKA